MGRENAIGLLIAMAVVVLWARRRRKMAIVERRALEKRDRRAIVLLCWFYVGFVAFAYLVLALR